MSASLRVLVAPDSFKGSLTSVAVAQALARGWLDARPRDSVVCSPAGDGGEGTMEAVAVSEGWLSLPAATRDPLGRPIAARWLRRGDLGLVELAAASGLSLVPQPERDAGAASTFGTGLVMAAAIGLGCRRIILALGGSATTDGGTGLLVALGARFLDAEGSELPMGGAALAQLAQVDLRGLSPVLAEVGLTIASDVDNPLLGPTGAAATYGPQKGADPDGVRQLDAGLARLADVLEAQVSPELRDQPGAGAAGGTTFGLLAIADRFASFEMRPGADIVLELTGFDERLAVCDLVLTGEGRVDAQTAHGKTAVAVARRAAALGKPCICFGGGITEAGEQALAKLGAVCVPVGAQAASVEEAMAAGAAPIERAAARTARLLEIGLTAPSGR